MDLDLHSQDGYGSTTLPCGVVPLLFVVIASTLPSVLVFLSTCADEETFYKLQCVLIRFLCM
jgi:hypothetical protein